MNYELILVLICFCNKYTQIEEGKWDILRLKPRTNNKKKMGSQKDSGQLRMFL